MNTLRTDDITLQQNRVHILKDILHDIFLFDMYQMADVNQFPQSRHVYKYQMLTHWGRVMHICVRNLTITGSDNGLSPDRRQAIILTNAGILLIGPLGLHWNFNRNSNIFIQENALEDGVCEMASIILSRPQCVNTLPFVVQWLH